MVQSDRKKWLRVSARFFVAFECLLEQVLKWNRFFENLKVILGLESALSVSELQSCNKLSHISCSTVAHSTTRSLSSTLRPTQANFQFSNKQDFKQTLSYLALERFRPLQIISNELVNLLNWMLHQLTIRLDYFERIKKLIDVIRRLYKTFLEEILSFTSVLGFNVSRWTKLCLLVCFLSPRRWLKVLNFRWSWTSVDSLPTHTASTIKWLPSVPSHNPETRPSASSGRHKSTPFMVWGSAAQSLATTAFPWQSACSKESDSTSRSTSSTRASLYSGLNQWDSKTSSPPRKMWSSRRHFKHFRETFRTVRNHESLK